MTVDELIVRILPMIQSNVRNSIPGIYHEYFEFTMNPI